MAPSLAIKIVCLPRLSIYSFTDTSRTNRSIQRLESPTAGSSTFGKGRGRGSLGEGERTEGVGRERGATVIFIRKTGYREFMTYFHSELDVM